MITLNGSLKEENLVTCDVLWIFGVSFLLIEKNVYIKIVLQSENDSESGIFECLSNNAVINPTCCVTYFVFLYSCIVHSYYVFSFLSC